MMRRPHQSTSLLAAHDKHREFLHWSRAEILTLRAMSSGQTMNTQEIEQASVQFGERLSYPMARHGVVFLEGDYPGLSHSPEKTDAYAIFMGSERPGGVYLQRLTDRGMKLAALSLSIYPPQQAEAATNQRPPDPRTPLWRVLGIGTEYLVIASSAERAMAIVEAEREGETASRATPIPTDAELILGYETARERTESR